MSIIYSQGKTRGPEDELLKVQVKFEIIIIIIYKIEIMIVHITWGLVQDLKCILSFLLCELDGHTVICY